MKNGLYKIAFHTPIGLGFGVAYLKDGLIRGGDSSMYYTGKYQLNEGTITGSVLATVHSSEAHAGSVFGVDRVNISLKGTADDSGAKLEGTASEAPGITFQAQMTWLAD